MKKEMYVAECPKCGLTYKGDANYFRKDLKEKCFDGITELVNYRIAGEQFDTNADNEASRLIANALAWLEAEKLKVLAE